MIIYIVLPQLELRLASVGFTNQAACSNASSNRLQASQFPVSVTGPVSASQRELLDQLQNQIDSRLVVAQSDWEVDHPRPSARTRAVTEARLQSEV